MSYLKMVQLIEFQRQGKEALPEWTVGEQLLDMARDQPELAELLAQDLDVTEMNLSAAAAKIKEYADKNHGNAMCCCVTPTVAERILRKFYHLPEADAATDNRPPAGSTAPMVDLADFL